MQGHRDLVEVADLILRELTPLVNAQYGAFFVTREGGADQSRRPNGKVPDLELIAGYGLQGSTDMRGVMAQGLVRQAASEQRRILVDEVPPDYIKVSSGLGEATPASIVIIPILFEDKQIGIIELASFHRFSDVHLAFFDQFVNTIGVAINTILANARTEVLLSESQSLAALLQERSDELQRQQAELRESNEALEEKAAQLASSSQYKSEFLANMSHELRTPLSSVLIYARLLADNAPGHLSDEEVTFATSIHRSGSDLLQLINDILDLSKVEAGRLDIRLKKLPLAKLVDYVNSTFGPIAVDHGLAFEVDVSADAPAEMHSDEQRLQQILRNLLSNAIKFTSEGRVRLRVERPEDPGQALPDAEDVVAFTVEDTGIGIAGDKLAMIFEAFEQAHGAASHKYGGTGLGLSISRELAALLGGRIAVQSEPGRGSSFTLYVPVIHPSRTRPEPAALADEVLDEPGSAKHQVLVSDDAMHWTTEREQGEQPATVTPLAEWNAERAARMLSGKVLIVDDDIRIVIALTQLLGRVGLPAVYALNGREGIEVLERNPDVSLVLMDIMMPVMDGYEAISEIRRSAGYADLPIVVLSAKAIPGEREKALGVGANEYLQKPVVDVDRLLQIACDLLAPEGNGEGPQAVPGERGPDGSDYGARGASRDETPHLRHHDES
jgi:signal transduction histidine kinase/CheY-like chemotaxis protein